MDSKNYNQQFLRPDGDIQRHGVFDEAVDDPPPAYPPVSYAEYVQYQNEEFPESMQEGVPAEQQENTLLEQTLRWIPQCPATGQGSSVPLRKPVVVPRIDVNSMLRLPLPWLRAYSPDLRRHGVNERDFVAFIDNLTVAQAAPAPLQALDLAGRAVGFVPNHWAKLAGFGANVAAGVGTAAITRVRTRRFMQTVNQEYFAPRGLKATLVKNKDLAEKLGYSYSLPLLAPFDISSTDNNLRDRRMKILEPFIAPLSLNVPPPAPQRSIIDKMSAKQIEFIMKKKQKEDAKSLEKERQRRIGMETLQQRGQGSRASSEPVYFSDSNSTLSSVSSRSSEVDELQKLDREILEINRKADREVSKHPSKAEKTNQERYKKVVKLEEKRDKCRRKIDEKAQKRESKAEAKQAKRDHKLGKKATKNEKRSEKRMIRDNKKADGMEFILIEKL